MLSFSNRLIVTVFSALVGLLCRPAGASDLESLSRHPQWLAVYQYVPRGDGYQSEVESDRFFFSPEGNINPHREMEAAIVAYQDSTKTYGTLKLPAACTYPVRRQILEGLLRKKFPKVHCPDLDQWISRVNADQVSMMYVGAYSGNAASILGHTFLRFSNSLREKSGREGIDLLTYAVGFTAHAGAEDGRLTYMLKGLTGGYPGFYDIEPYYMKVGIYNNSESRDLWEVRLDYSREETELLLKLVWEYTFNSQIRYYFIGKNCSFRLLKLLDIVRPQGALSASFRGIVLPAETVRSLEKKKQTQDKLEFRSSILRRLRLKRQLLSEEQREEFDRSTTSLEVTRNISDPTLADALLDYWLYETYSVQTHLPPAQQRLVDALHVRAATLPGRTRFAKTNSEIRQDENLSPPFRGHKSHWMELEAGSSSQNAVVGISARAGVHPYWSNDRGYNEISAVEYLGMDYQKRMTESDRWKFQFIKVQNFEDFFDYEKKASWSFDVRITNQCLICATDRPQFQMSGSYGLSHRYSQVTFSLLPDLKTAVWEYEQGVRGVLAPGLKAYFKWDLNRWIIYAEWSHHWWERRNADEFDIRLGYTPQKDLSIYVKHQKDTIMGSVVRYF